MAITDHAGELIPAGSVKICGLREVGHAVTAVRAGADLIGFNFAPSRRFIEPLAAREAIIAARRAATSGVIAVGIFVNERPERMNEIAAIAGLDLIQLSGDEPPEVAKELRRPYLRGLRLPSGATSADITATVDQWKSQAPLGFLLDGHKPGHFGGTGVKADWALAANVAGMVPVVLAGGLTPANVGDAISAVRPRGVDVASGVEVDGRNDHEAIVAFIQRAKAAFAALAT